MNIAANVVQGPARALIGDLSPPSKQQIAQVRGKARNKNVHI